MRKKVVIVLLLIIIVFLLIPKSKKNGIKWQSEQSNEVEKKYITLQGFSQLTFTAGTTQQKVNFYNPESNTCIMDIQLYLPDEELLLEEKDIYPGYGIAVCNISRPLEAGYYKNCKLIVKCRSSDGIQYNGAVMSIDVNVY